MKIYSMILLFILALIALFAVLNWGVFLMPTELSLGFTTVSLPLSLVMLGLLIALELSGSVLSSLSVKTKETLTYKTGEITTASTLTCQACSMQVHLKETGRTPPCPKCSSTLFSKGY